jgi:hypothetical protein
MVRQNPDLPDSICAELANPPAAGTGVNRWLFRMACRILPYRSEEETYRLLAIATANCGRAVTANELTHQIAGAARVLAESGRGRPSLLQRLAISREAWPKPNLDEVDFLVRTGMRLVDLRENSPLKLNPEQSPGPKRFTDELVDLLFPNNPLLCAGLSACKAATRRREVWRGHLWRYALIVPSPMIQVWGKTKDGKWSQHTLENTGPRKYLVIEFDFAEFALDDKVETIWAKLLRAWKADLLTTADASASLIAHLAHLGPLVLVVDSAGKSLHAWFSCLDQTECQLRSFMQAAVRLGADPSTWTRSQFVRMPDGTRENGCRQGIHFFSPEVIHERGETQ